MKDIKNKKYIKPDIFVVDINWDSRLCAGTVAGHNQNGLHTGGETTPISDGSADDQSGHGQSSDGGGNRAKGWNDYDDF